MDNPRIRVVCTRKDAKRNENEVSSLFYCIFIIVFFHLLFQRHFLLYNFGTAHFVTLEILMNILLHYSADKVSSGTIKTDRDREERGRSFLKLDRGWGHGWGTLASKRPAVGLLLIVRTCLNCNANRKEKAARKTTFVRDPFKSLFLCLAFLSSFDSIDHTRSNP